MGKDVKKRSQSPQNLPALARMQQAVASFVVAEVSEKAVIPNAALIYGVGAAALFAFAFFHLMTGHLIFAILLALLGGLMFAYAVFFIRSVDKRGRK